MQFSWLELRKNDPSRWWSQLETLSAVRSIDLACFGQIGAFIKILSDSLSTATINARNWRHCLRPCPLAPVPSLLPSILGRHNLRRRDESGPLFSINNRPLPPAGPLFSGRRFPVERSETRRRSVAKLRCFNALLIKDGAFTYACLIWGR